MPVLKGIKKVCFNCNTVQKTSTRKCPKCGLRLTKTGKRCGRPAGRSSVPGYKVSSGRPVGTTVVAGYQVSTSGGRPDGTTVAAGYQVSTSGGRPDGTTVAAGYNVGTSGGRPVGISVNVYDLSTAQISSPDFVACDLLTNWDVSQNTLNITHHLVTKLSDRIFEQRTFDQQPLTKRICWQCGCVLWGNGSSKGSYLIDPPKGMLAKDAPANAFLKAADNCSLTFEHDGRKLKWYAYACSYCTNNQLPSEMYVGDVLDTSMSLKPVHLWELRKPQPVGRLHNRYETGHVSLCGLFSTTVKKASMSQ